MKKGKNILKFLLLLLIAFQFQHCSKKSQVQITPEDYRGKVYTSPNKAWDDFQSIKDTLKSYWELMEKSDKQKFKNLATIQKKIKKSGDYNSETMENAIFHLEKVQNFQFTETRILDDKYIDEYDSLTNKAINSTTKLMDEKEDFCEKCQDEIKDVNELENLLIAYRIHYDEWAELYNWYINKHKTKLEKRFVDPNDLTPKPIFKIKEKK